MGEQRPDPQRQQQAVCAADRGGGPGAVIPDPVADAKRYPLRKGMYHCLFH